MKIIIQQTNTIIFIEEIDEKHISSIIKSIEVFKNCKIIFYEDSFSLDIVLNNYQKVMIKKALNKIKSKEGIISGFKGCLITGYKMEWI